ncbi:GNAT family N-acetyltransferase [Algiphilus sp. NNCM1]|uniref:GNAT family N-acetyltransferase n=1 Tax=Algiphilus sp. TaxID=1872431 RepID=UPI001CA5FB3B|nr:GNAT family protein [Algiphilus sp.]MBY8965037.1 GNAT family N-acetyltransferase [Algiphilus acroporae]MCI5104193.1 GNAT family N-acetyltransferase [Algiphilus sp.]
MELQLRPLDLNDIDDEFVSWHQNEDGHLDFFTGSRRSFTGDDLHQWISQSTESNTHFFLILGSDGTRIGTIKIGPIDLVNKTSDLVCLIGNREYLGKGLAKEAIALGNEVAFKELDIRRLHGGMFENNIASIKAYTRAGWVIEGKMKGYYLVNGEPMDRICVACFNPSYFPEQSRNDN